MVTMRLLVTGSEGSLGQMVISRLRARGHDVVGIDNQGRYGVVHRPRDYTFIQGDLRDPRDVARLFAEGAFHATFHLAALVYGVVGFHAKPADIIVDNCLAAMNLLHTAGTKVGKLVYLSSSMVYERSSRVPHSEPDADDSAVMSTSYGLSKYVGERLVKAFHEQHGLTYVIWRPFNIITPFEAPEETGFSHVFTDFVRKIVGERLHPVPVLGDGHQVRCFTSIFDVAPAIADFSLDPRSDNETFNIGNPEPVTIRELAGRIVTIAVRMGLLPTDYQLEFRSEPTFVDDVRTRIPDVAKLQRVFGWSPGVLLDQSLETYIRHRYPAATGQTA
jgi:UDP-glucose 4-epimerase